MNLYHNLFKDIKLFGTTLTKIGIIEYSGIVAYDVCKGTLRVIPCGILKPRKIIANLHFDSLLHKVEVCKTKLGAY